MSSKTFNHDGNIKVFHLDTYNPRFKNRRLRLDKKCPCLKGPDNNQYADFHVIGSTYKMKDIAAKDMCLFCFREHENEK